MLQGVGGSFLSLESFTSDNRKDVTRGCWYIKMVSQSFIPGLARDCYWGEKAEDMSPAPPRPKADLSHSWETSSPSIGLSFDYGDDNRSHPAFEKLLCPMQKAQTALSVSRNLILEHLPLAPLHGSIDLSKGAARRWYLAA